MQNRDELPGCEAANYHAEILNTPSLIWQMLNSKRFWLYVVATCTVGAVVMHFGLVAVSAATASVLIHACHDLPSKISSSASLLTIAALSLASLFSPIGSLFYKKPQIDVVDESNFNDYNLY